MIPRGVASSPARTGGTSLALNMQRMREMRSQGRKRACRILSAGGPTRENLDRPRSTIPRAAGGVKGMLAPLVACGDP